MGLQTELPEAGLFRIFQTECRVWRILGFRFFRFKAQAFGLGSYGYRLQGLGVQAFGVWSLKFWMCLGYVPLSLKGCRSRRFITHLAALSLYLWPLRLARPLRRPLCNPAACTVVRWAQVASAASAAADSCNLPTLFCKSTRVITWGFILGKGQKASQNFA